MNQKSSLLNQARIVSLVLTPDTMNQKSSVAQTPKSVRRALTSDSICTFAETASSHGLTHRGATILKMREEIKKQTIHERRLQHQYAAA